MIKVKVNNEYKDVVKIFCGGTLQKEITKVWSREAQEYVYESSVEYSGSLPITITANGDALIDYRIYGADGGVGVATENLFDGEMESGYYDNNGEKQSSNNWIRCKNLISTNSNTVYHAIIDDPEVVSGSVVFARCYDVRGEFIGTANQTVIQYYKEYAFTTIDNTAFISFYVSEIYRNAKFAIYQTTVSHKPYIPYGYKLPMTAGNGDTEQTVPVYIGENQLDAGEYVSYGEQKIYKRTENLCENDFRQGGGYWYQDYGNREQRCSQESLIPVTPSTEYTMSWTNGSLRYAVQQYNNQDKDQTTNPALYDSGWKIGNSFSFTTTSNVHYIWLQFSSPNYSYNIVPTDSLVSVVEGSTAPTEYIPYVAPADPPVPLPEIPTIDGTTVIDYDGDPKPSQMYVKYRR